MSAARDWIREHLRTAPAELIEVMVRAVPDAARDGVADALAAGAVTLYAEVVEGSGGREDALSLLAADALLTHAFEVQASIRPDRLKEFAARWGVKGELAKVRVQ